MGVRSVPDARCDHRTPDAGRSSFNVFYHGYKVENQFPFKSG